MKERLKNRKLFKNMLKIEKCYIFNFILKSVKH